MRERNPETRPAERGPSCERPSRRKLLKAGAFLLPAVVTLHARTALGQTESDPLETLNRHYTDMDYLYGNNEGMSTFDVNRIADPAPQENEFGEPIWEDADGNWHTYGN